MSIALAASAIASGPAHDVAATLGALRGIVVPERPFATDIPPVARVLMANAKAELRELAGTLLRDQPAGAKAAAANLTTALRDALNETEVLKECDSQYGALLTPVVTAPAADLVAVQVVLAIPCGQDASLFLFRHEDGRWRLVLDHERNDYEEVSGGSGDLSFRVSAPDPRGSYLVISADITPWCSSNWQSMRYDVFRINSGWRDPEPIAGGVEVIYLEDEIGLDVAPDSFSLTFAGSSIDPSRVVRGYQRHYRVEAGNRLTRVDPIADTPLEFVEEWLLMNEDHKPLVEGGGEFAVPARCSDGVWEIHYDLYRDDGEEPAYFYVAEENGAFRMVAAGKAQREGCDGKPSQNGDKLLCSAANPSPITITPVRGTVRAPRRTRGTSTRHRVPASSTAPAHWAAARRRS